VLVRKGRGFSDSEKGRLWDTQRACNRVDLIQKKRLA